MNGLKICLSKKRKIKEFATSKIEVVLFDKKEYKVAVRVIEGFTGLVDYLEDLRNKGMKAERIIRQNINGQIRTIYSLSPIK